MKTSWADEKEDELRGKAQKEKKRARKRSKKAEVAKEIKARRTLLAERRANGDPPPGPCPTCNSDDHWMSDCPASKRKPSGSPAKGPGRKRQKVTEDELNSSKHAHSRVAHTAAVTAPQTSPETVRTKKSKRTEGKKKRSAPPVPIGSNQHPVGPKFGALFSSWNLEPPWPADPKPTPDTTPAAAPAAEGKRSRKLAPKPTDPPREKVDSLTAATMRPTKAQREESLRGREVTKLLQDGTSTYIPLPKSLERVSLIEVVQALNTARVSGGSLLKSGNGFLLRANHLVTASRWVGTTITVRGVKLKIEVYHKNDRRFYLLENTGVFPDASVAKALFKHFGKKFYLQHAGVGGFTTDQYLVTFEEPPGVHSTVVPLQELTREEEGKVSVWRARLSSVDLDRCPVCCAAHANGGDICRATVPVPLTPGLDFLLPVHHV